MASGPSTYLGSYLLASVADLTEDQRQALLRCAYVLILNLEEDGKADAGTAEALLDGMVVAPGEGRRAWRELKSCVSEASAAAGRTFNTRLDGGTATGGITPCSRC
jgi:hypothetical protein